MNFRIYNIFKKYKNDIYNLLKNGFCYFTVWSLILLIFSKNFTNSNALIIAATLLVLSCSLIGSSLIYLHLDNFAKMRNMSKQFTIILDLLIHILPFILIFLYYPLPKLNKKDLIYVFVYMILFSICYLCCYKPKEVYNPSKLNNTQLISINIITLVSLFYVFFV